MYRRVIWETFSHLLYDSLRQKCPNTEFFLVRIFVHSDWRRRHAKYLSIFSPNVQKYGHEKNPVFGHFSRNDFSFNSWHCFWWLFGLIMSYFIMFSEALKHLVSLQLVLHLSRHIQVHKQEFFRVGEVF